MSKATKHTRKTLRSFDDIEDFYLKPNLYQNINVESELLTESSLVCLVLGLVNHTSKLTDIRLKDVCMDDLDASFICAAIYIRRCITTRMSDIEESIYPNLLDFSDNNLTDSCLQFIFNMCACVSVLRLRDNYFGEGVIGFKSHVLKTTISRIELNGNNIPKKVCDSIRPFACFDSIIHTKEQRWEYKIWLEENVSTLAYDDEGVFCFENDVGSQEVANEKKVSLSGENPDSD